MFFIMQGDLCYGTADSPVTIDPAQGVLIEHNGDFITTVDNKVLSINHVWRLPCKVIPYENPTEDLVGTFFQG